MVSTPSPAVEDFIDRAVARCLGEVHAARERHCRNLSPAAQNQLRSALMRAVHDLGGTMKVLAALLADNAEINGYVLDELRHIREALTTDEPDPVTAET